MGRWRGRVAARPLLARATGAATDRNGRVVVQPDLTLPGHPEIFVIGDMAHVEQDGALLPGVAPVAMPQGRYVARCIAARVAGAAERRSATSTRARWPPSAAPPPSPTCAWLRFSGLLAWLAWLFIHLMYLVEFENRLLVLVQWAWNYVTRNRGARLITGDEPAAAADHEAASD